RVLQIDGEGHVLGVLTDITDSRRTEAALRTSDERFRELAETISEVFWMTDPNKGDMLYISPAYESIWGRSRESLYASPKDWLNGIHPDDRMAVLAAIAKQGTSGYDEEYRIVRPDGGVRWIRDRAFPMRDQAGRVTRIAGVAEDITERRGLEAQLRQTQKLESVVMLAGGVAHDFNNLLTVIQANAELLGEAPTREEIAETIAEIRGAAERGSSLTRQLLAFSRQEMLEPRIVNINAVVNDTSKMLRRLIGEDVELTINLAPDVSPVLIDPGHFSQVLMNLAVNARDAMPKGGSLTLRTVNFRVTEAEQAITDRAPGRYVGITLADTGHGMTPEVRAKVFEPFFTTKGPGRGTGLGLAVVHGIVSQSGGYIDVASTLGTGTTFTILLPVAKEGLTAEHAEAETTPGGDETILLVEDEEVVRRVAARALRNHGYTVIEARDGADALTVLSRARQEIDLLLTDVVMPRMDGRTLAETIAKSHPATRVIYMSGYTDDAVVRHGVQRAEVQFLQKPYTVCGLLTKVRVALDAQGAPAETQRLAGVS
ncbi:MAG TPA: PAS domain-containing protein, partial [Gemmatimonadales bacterium]